MNATENDEPELDTRSPLKFYLFLLFAITSTLCTVYLFYCFTTNKRFRRSITHDVIFLLLLVTFLTIIIPVLFTIIYFASGHAWSQSDIFCSLWNWLMYSLCLMSLCLMTFNCLQRHLFIFNHQFYHSKNHRVFFHYLPMIFCLIYPIVFYTVAIFGTPCTHTYDYTAIFCIWPCYYNNGYWLGYFDVLVNTGSTNFLIPIFLLTLLGRCMKQKHRMQQQAFKWRRDRKMLLQLLSISTLYMIFWFPDNLVSLVEMWQPTFLVDFDVNVLVLGPLFLNTCYPIICLLTYPEFLYKRKRSMNRVAIT